MHLSSASEKSFMVRFVRSSRDSSEGERNYLTIYYMYVAHETSNGLTQLHFLSVNWGMTSSIILSHFSHKEQFSLPLIQTSIAGYNNYLARDTD